MSAALPPGPELYRRNRRIAADRCGWPAGALATCERLDREYPPWRVTWMAASTIRGWERPAGYAAIRDGVSMPRADELRRLPEDGVARQPHVFGATVPALLTRMAAMEERIAADRAARELLWRSLLDR